MSRIPPLLRMVACIAAVGFGSAAPSVVQAQGGTMTFGEEEAQEVQDEDKSDEKTDDQQEKTSGGEEGEGMNFETETGVEKESSESSTPVLGLVAVPNDAMSSSQRRELKDKLVEAMQEVPDVELATGTAVLEALRERTVSSCVTEPLCLGTVGGEASVDRIVMARVDRKEGNYQLDVDYFNVSERLFIEYKSVSNLGSFDEVLGAVTPAVEEIFNLGSPGEGQQTYARRDNSKALNIIAITSSGLAAGALTAGILFGTEANQLESELTDARNANGRYDGLTQLQAQNKLNKAQNRAGVATGFYITSGVLAATGGVLFLVNALNSGGSEKPPPSQRQTSGDSRSSWRITPTAGGDELGVQAQFRF